jgi:CRP/FNR family cyclic AMP-dependent transcriptional regulator
VSGKNKVLYIDLQREKMTPGEQLLANIPLFESLTAEELRVLSGRLEERVAQPGEVIFHQGEESGRLFLIAEGAVEISFGDSTAKVTLAQLFTGQYFGELSLFDQSPRSATATAIKATQLMTLGANEVVDFVNRYPAAAMRIIAEMSERLRQTNELMSRQVSRNVNEEAAERLTFGQRIADRVAAFGGSWPFIILFVAATAAWMAINVMRFAGFDPYPFILLNLALAIVTALQAPLIMMSQNRQAMKDKLLAENDYQVNLKSEMEIAAIMRIQAELLARLTYLERAMLKKDPTKTSLGLVPPLSPD